MYSSHRTRAAFVALLATLSCGSPGRPAAPSSGRPSSPGSSQCLFRRDPTKPDLMALDATYRAQLRRLRGFGVLAVRYEQVGCTVSIVFLPDCLGSAKYRYSAENHVGSVTVTSDQEAVAELPLGAESLEEEIGPGNAVRIDYVTVGQYALSPDQPVAGWDRPECQQATHYVSRMYVGALARTFGERDAVRMESGPFELGGAPSVEGDQLVWRTDGSPKACEQAQQKGQENAGCDRPLRLELVALPGRGKAVPKPVPPPTCPPGMAGIPGGTFMMGSASGEPDEKPVHSVKLPAFCLDIDEVTVDGYAECVTAGRCTAPAQSADEYCNWGKPGKGSHPVNCVSFDQAAAYCQWQHKTLPSEEQWEYAARGGQEGRVYPWGSDAPSASTLCWDRRGQGTCEVGRYPGAFGLNDMAGGVWEWTQTKYCDSYAPGKKCDEMRVLRGGGWSSTQSAAVRATNRAGDVPTHQGGNLGFRCGAPAR
jgi:formylglycine-generating enzyme required for sulfatase activity